ncbi:glycosyl hydrolase family 95 catalytic domain-containing protein [Paenibacillus tepidiphilus]|uniref:glycoside hydrolase family 95 protein n=1 Tax=Paenibacillus tepidiphilus TaxID=2608683 RepID=UPI00123B977A|nr:glycoside hydrolase family 95 protein [Paenibacillus tepidiphilus]
MNEKTIWYNHPAEKWEEAMPIGNGTLGGMVFGSTGIERMQLNEDSLWYGGPMNRNNPHTLTHLDEIRGLLFAGQIRQAEDLASTALVGTPDGQRHYEPLGDLYLHMGDGEMKIRGYRRQLDLDLGLVRVDYHRDEVHYSREYFSSFPDQVLAVRLTAGTPGGLSFSTLFGRGSVLEPTPWSDILRHPVGFHAYVDRIEHRGPADLIIRGRSGGEEGIRFCCAIRIVADGGQISAGNGQLTLKDGNSATILVSACTDFRFPKEELEAECLNRLDRAAGKSYEQLRSSHIEDYRALFGRMELSLQGKLDQQSLSDLATDQRLQRLQQGAEDNGLIGLYFHFGRYLLISCSRPGSLPANLQGIWNKDMLPIWDSKYTININTQMNYWPAESCNLAECHIPLFDFIGRIRERGTETAGTMYGSRGFVAHHNSDIWADTAPQDVCITSTFWVMGAAWLSLHLWDHYEYGRDLSFLKNAYPTMKEAALFLLDYLITDPDGNLVISPSSSPENRYVLPNGESGALCYGASMDSQIIRELFGHCIESTEILQEDEDFGELLRQTLARIPGLAVGKHGQIQEWSVDYEELEPGHRHISHLFALHPGSQITPHSTPVLAEAAGVTLRRRLTHGGGHTGWSRAWILNMWARLEEPELAYENILELLRSSTLPNLFCDHPPFQIDGNFGGTAGIAEMLVQRQGDDIRLLPALPAAWSHGSVRGLRVRGGYEIAMSWSNGELQQANICSLTEGKVTVSYINHRIKLDFPGPGFTVSLSPESWVE